MWEKIKSHLTRGAWIEIKISLVKSIKPYMQSHLTRGAWIEISTIEALPPPDASRTSHEVRGLKYLEIRLPCASRGGRTSHEVRGLK